MKCARTIAFAVGMFCRLGDVSGQEGDSADFAAQVQPLFQSRCIECHGPTEQRNGLRLDRRQDALRGGTIDAIVPGNSGTSRLYLKLIGNQYGPQMPPDAPLSAEDIEIVKNWIDQGAKWPDELAGEIPVSIPDPPTERLMEALRAGDGSAFRAMLQADPKIARMKGSGGDTPLMYAALYGDLDAIRLLLESGANVNARNDAGVTALMWAVGELETTQLLLQHGADVDARSNDGRTPIIIAADRFGAAPVVKALLDKGANPTTMAHSYRGPTSALREAADAGDDATLRLLIERGAKPEQLGPFALISALNGDGAHCADAMIQSADRKMLKAGLVFISPPFGNPKAIADANLIQKLLEHGADVHARDQNGRTMLMLAASSDSTNKEFIEELISRGADLNVTTADDKTALDFAMRRGKTAIVEALVNAGAREGAKSSDPVKKPSPARSPRAALARSIPLLQRADVMFIQKTGCVSCHHNSLTAMTVASARKHEIPVNEDVAQQQIRKTVDFLARWRERTLQGIAIPGDSNTVNYLLAGLAAEQYPADVATDAQARALLRKQSSDGHWRLIANRPPLESSEFEVTALALRALQVYGLKAQEVEYRRAVERAAGWLAKERPTTTADRVFQLLGLKWAGGFPNFIDKTASELLSEQHPDGGWSQLPSLSSDAYATGQVLTALYETGALVATDPAHMRGTKYLMDTQLEDGSWHVKTRALPFQPYFESGFPHGPDQWISAAATNWASMALIPAAR